MFMRVNSKCAHQLRPPRWPAKRLEPPSQWFMPLAAAFGAEQNDWPNRAARKDSRWNALVKCERDPLTRGSN
jgi:hypothetical protein